MRVESKHHVYVGTQAECAKFAKDAGLLFVDVFCDCQAVAEAAQVAETAEDGSVEWYPGEYAARVILSTYYRAKRECYTGRCSGR